MNFYIHPVIFSTILHHLCDNQISLDDVVNIIFNTDKGVFILLRNNQVHVLQLDSDDIRDYMTLEYADDL